MRRNTEVVKADVRRGISSPHRQSDTRPLKELDIHVTTLTN